MAREVPDLLDRLTISTKVGFFPTRDGPRHSLDPLRLRTALERTARDLGRTPDLVFLHNPERSLRGERPDRARTMLGEACAALDDAVSEGMCGAWGVASWDPSPLPALLDRTIPRPGALMVRAGLFVGIEALDASAALAARWQVPGGALWGMSPFGGDAANVGRAGADPRLFVRDGGCSRVQAAFRVACRLPVVSALAVGADDPRHLGELLDGLRLTVDDRMIRRYVELLRSRRAAVSPAEVP